MRTAGTAPLRWATCLWFLASSVASAQIPYGLSPLRLEIQVRPGGVGEGRITVRSHSRTDALPMPFEIRPFVQDRQGMVRLGDPEDEVPRSCVDWISVIPTAVVLRPGETREVKIRVAAPPDARGTYCAVFLTSPAPVDGKPAKTAEGADVVVGVVFRIAAVIDITVVGPTPSQSCQLTGGALKHVTVGKGAEARQSTAVVLTASNTGETVLRVRPKVTVLCDVGGRPMRVWSGTREPVRIYPAAERDITLDTGRLWPGGTYDIHATLDSEGSQIASRELAAELPEPAGGTVAQVGDIPLEITPSFARLDARPGATRTLVVTVRNLADFPARLRVQALVPSEIRSLVSRSGGEAPSFSCDAWLEVQPAEFELAPGRSRNVRVLARVPEDAEGSYYARLLFEGSDLTDTLHVQRETLAWVATPGQVTREAKLGSPELAALGGTTYTVKLSLRNIGSIHFEPKGSVSVVGVMGDALATAPMTSDKPLVLRHAETTMAGNLDLKTLSNGDYDLKCVVALGDEATAAAAALLRVNWDGGKQRVTLVAPEGEPSTGTAVPVPEPAASAQTPGAGPPPAGSDAEP